MAENHQLPATLIPEGDICVPLFIPDHPDYVALLVRAVRLLELDRHYVKVADKSGLVVREQWRTRTITPLIEALNQGQSCSEGSFTEEDDCLNYPPYAPFITYNLYNPYRDPTTVPPGYLFNPYIPGGYPLFEPDDLIVDFFSFPIFANWWDLLTGNLPRIEIHTVGDGQIELDLLNIIQGGHAIIKVGSPPNVLDVIAGIYEAEIRVVDLGIDVAIPTELDVVHAEEVDIVVGAGVEETTYITFIPVIDDAIPPFGLPLRFGGGLRQVGLCGFEEMGVIMGITDLRVTDCGIETFEDGVWTLKGSLDNCIAPIIADLAAHEVIATDTFTDIDSTIEVNEGRLDELETAEPELNEYPDPPTGAEPDALCGSAWRVAEKLEALCQDALTNAQTITLLEWLDIILPGGGWESSAVVQLWNLAYANANPTLSADLNTAIAEIAGILYCAQLNRTTTILDIQSHATLPADVKIFYEAAIASLKFLRWNAWVFTGSLDTSRDCSGLSCGTWCYRFDVNTGFAPFNLIYGTLTARGIDNAHWDVGSNTFSGWQLRIETVDVPGLVSARMQTHHIASGIQNSTILNMLHSQGEPGTGYTNVVNGGWNGVPLTRDIIENCEGWDNVHIYGTTAAKSGSMYASAGEGYLEFIELAGTGFNPFGQDNCLP